MSETHSREVIVNDCWNHGKAVASDRGDGPGVKTDRLVEDRWRLA